MDPKMSFVVNTKYKPVRKHLIWGTYDWDMPFQKCLQLTLWIVGLTIV